MPSLRGPVHRRRTQGRGSTMTDRPCRSDGPLEGRHPAFPCAPRGAHLPKKAPGGAREGRMPSLQGPVHCRRTQGPRSTMAERPCHSDGPSEGRHSAFPCALRGAHLSKKAPDGAREGRMPSLQGPAHRRRTQGPRSTIAERPCHSDGPLEGRHPAFPCAPQGAHLSKKAPGGAGEGRMPSLQGPVHRLGGK